MLISLLLPNVRTEYFSQSRTDIDALSLAEVQSFFINFLCFFPNDLSAQDPIQDTHL